MKSWIKPLTLVLLFVGVLLAYYFTPVSQLLNKEAISNFLEQFGVWAPLGYLFLKTIFTAIGVPATILTLISGAVFGVAQGSVYSITGATIGSVGAFLIARYLARDWAQSKFAAGGKLTELDKGLKDNALWFVLSTRITPLFPFNVVNTLFGLTSVSLRNYTLGTFFGIIPGTIVYVWLGSSGQEALSGGSKWGVLGAFAALGILSLLPVLLGALNKNKQTSRKA
ncbi:TVP38/TMEM64 family protein [Anthocerotibacter panamensis]|uniref:TVP38/TMEM64 family protein n=1 Tax=Anthocerotibacter panamensis TaxID=2857077 RepID=UPI001C404DDE|nr:TVP38/TMEM64 family protein [Anthocerotibacter panamensis]